MARIAVVLADDFEDRELESPREALADAGHVVDLIGTDTGTVVGKRGLKVALDRAIDEVVADEYDALVIPGGYSPDRLRTDDRVVAFARRCVERGVPVAAICHAPSLLIEADVVRGRTLTSFPSIRTDLRNAGASVVDEEVCVDRNLITSRDPGDLPSFNRAILVALAG